MLVTSNVEYKVFIHAPVCSLLNGIIELLKGDKSPLWSSPLEGQILSSALEQNLMNDLKAKAWENHDHKVSNEQITMGKGYWGRDTYVQVDLLNAIKPVRTPTLARIRVTYPSTYNGSQIKLTKNINKNLLYGRVYPTTTVLNTWTGRS